MNAVYILWLRQFKRYIRSPARLVASLAQPMMFLIALGFGLGSIFARAGQGSYIQFLVPGIVAMSIIFSSIFSGMEMLWDRQFGFLKETLVAPVPRFAIVLGRVAGGATTAMIQGAIVLIISTAFGFRPHSWLVVPEAFAVMLLISLLFSAFGMVVGSKMTDMQAFPLIMNFIVMPLFFLSGAMFPLHGLPTPLLIVATADPLSYGVDALRQLLIGAGHFGFGLDIAVLSGLTLALLFLGSYFFSRMEV
ncbi:MAG: ABC transporter permease [Rhizomicrobium sp.]|jgi:ABC-2 type transport system permease protein